MQFYPFSRFPYVAVLDPRTGENLRSWSTIRDSVTFCDLVTEFLNDHPSPNGAAGIAPILNNIEIDDFNNEAASSISNEAKEKLLYEASEDEQLKAAIAASLQEIQNHKNNTVVIDEDSDDLETFDSDDEIAQLANRQKSGNHVTEKKEEANSQNVVQAAAAVLATVVTEAANNVAEDWKKYLGQSEVNFELVFRFPDGHKEPTSFPSDSKLKVRFKW